MYVVCSMEESEEAVECSYEALSQWCRRREDANDVRALLHAAKPGAEAAPASREQAPTSSVAFINV